MIRIVTTAQMREIDKLSIGDKREVGFSFMLKAGIGLFDLIERLEIRKDIDEIAIVCGKGNNGGDGYVLGRLLVDNGYKVMCFGLCEGESLLGEARQAYDEYVTVEGNFFHIDDIADLEDFGRFTIIIDALLGTGIKGNPHGLYAEIIRHINASKKIVLAVDTPSGLNNDTREPGNVVVEADYTVSMGFPKIGQMFYPARSYLGETSIRELGYPIEIVEKESCSVFLPQKSDYKKILPERKPSGSKFEHGLALLVCGSKGMVGALTLASMSALRSGCGMVHSVVPQSLLSLASTKMTESVFHPVGETSVGSLGVKSVDKIVELSKSMQVALIGPGISHVSETSKLVLKLVQKLTIPIVLDADGINAFKGKEEDLKKHVCELVITPHEKEWERIFGNLSNEPWQRVKQLAEVAGEYNCTIVYKGNPTIVSGHSGKTFIMPVGNSALATAGSGDVLSGIIASLIAQGTPSEKAAILGVAIHGRAGELAGKDLTEYSVIASDLIDYIPDVFKEILL